MKPDARLIATSGVIFAARLLGAAVMLGVQVAIARLFGSASLGQYMLAAAAINIVAMILPLGFQTIAAYFGAAYGVRGQGRTLKVFLLQALVQTLAMGLAVALTGPWITAALGGHWPELGAVWGSISSSALALAVMAIGGITLTALKRPLSGYLGDALVRPILTAVALLVSRAAADTIPALLRAQSLLLLALAMVLALLTARAVAAVPGSEPLPVGEQRQWWFFAVPWAIVALAADFFFDLDLLLLSGRLSLTDLAVFGIATRLFALAGFAISAVYAVSLPAVFEAEAQGERAGLLARIRSVNTAAATLAALVICAVPIMAPLVLPVLGPDFAAAAGPLAILCVILLVRAVFGPAALVLSMERRPYVPLAAAAAGFALLLSGNAILVPRYGLYGAACSALIASSLWSLILWYLARRLTGLDVSLLPPHITSRTGA